MNTDLGQRAQHHIDRENLPTITINDLHLREITEETLVHLKKRNDAEPTLFTRGGALVRLHQDDQGVSSELMTHAALKGHLDREVNYVREDSKGRETPQRPPDDVVADIQALVHLPFPALRAIAKAPVLVKDGRLLSENGFDPKTGIFVSMNDMAREVVTDMPVSDAVGVLRDGVLGDFPFVLDGKGAQHSASLGHALSMFLVPHVMHLIDGALPMYLIDKPKRGTGAGLLVDVLAAVTLGHPAWVMSPPDDGEEMRKRITAALVGGASLVVLDNVRRLNSGALHALLTTRHWEDRILGKTQIVRLKNDALWVATGNNPSLSEEMVRRVVPVRMDAQVERPEDRRGFRHPDLMSFATKNRAELLSASLSIVEAWRRAGMPRAARTLGRFEDFTSIIGGILEVAGVPGFLENRETLYSESDREGSEWAAFCDAWYKTHGSRPVTAKDLLEIAKKQELLMDIWAGRSALAAQQRLGNALASRRDGVFGGYVVRHSGRDGATKSLAYRVEPLSNRGNGGRSAGGAFVTPETPVTPLQRGNNHGDEAGVWAKATLETPVQTPVNPRNPPSGDALPLGSKPEIAGVSGVSKPPATLLDPSAEDVEEVQVEWTL